jgi:flavin-dependent dehydrogenase
MTATSTDVLIAGAGPAGTHLALRLAREGKHVTLIDRARFPRPKPCGEFMSPECLPLLADLGLREDALALGARRVAGMRIHGHGHVAHGRYEPVGRAVARFDHGYAVRREAFDELCLRRAQACPRIEVLEGLALESLVFAPDGRVLGARLVDPAGERRVLRARFTVGADGLHSRVARQLGVQRALPWLRRYAVVARFEAPPEEDAEVHLFPGGYFAAAPIDGGAFTVNLVVGHGFLGGGGAAGLERDLRRALALAPPLAARLAEAPLVEPPRACGPLAGHTLRQTFDGAALVGDACGFVDPLTGEGMYFAMRGAELLAQSLNHALEAGRTDRAALAGYARARAREIVPRHALARLMQRGLGHQRLVERALGLLSERPGLANLAVALTGDYVPLRELLRPSVWWRAWNGASRAEPRTP